MLLGLAVVPFPQDSASASCAGPGLEGTAPLVLPRHAKVTVEGRGFTRGGCRDSGSCHESFGCQSCTYDDTPAVPLRAVHLRLQQRGHTWTVAVADAGTAKDQHLGRVAWTFELPRGVEAGRARLVPELAEPVWIQVR